MVIAVDASQFNDKPAGGGDRAAQHLTPKMSLHRQHLVELLGSFLPRMSNDVACRLVVKLSPKFHQTTPEHFPNQPSIPDHQLEVEFDEDCSRRYLKHPNRSKTLHSERS